MLLPAAATAQVDQIRTGTGLPSEKIRIAVSDFKPATGAAAGQQGTPNAAQAPAAGGDVTALKRTFDDTLYNDLVNAGIFDVVSKSFNPLQQPGEPNELKLDAWANPPTNAAMLAFGSIGVSGDRIAVLGWLYDVKNTGSPQVLGKQYNELASDANARLIAHKFADEIIFRLGGGIPGIAESKVFFISTRSGKKEVWEMDYDGANQHQLTHTSGIALSPRVSPDGSRVAFIELGSLGAEITMYSLELNRIVSFPKFGGTNASPAWAPDGSKLAFSSGRSGDPEIYVVDASGGGLRRVTAYHGPDVSPVWNPKTGAQIAWVSGRTKLPQIYVMEADGTNPARLTDTGYAVSPSWSPNGQYLTFAWNRKYGPGAPGGQDIYIMDVATKQWVQLTHDSGTNDYPSWSPDGRHIVFQSTRSGSAQIWMMLADGTQQKQLTRDGRNEQPNWSWH
jgi:TolB protein